MDSSIELFYKKIIGLIPKSHQEIFLILLLAVSLHYIIKLLYNTHAFIDPVLNHRSTYFKIVGYFSAFIPSAAMDKAVSFACGTTIS